MTIAATVLMGIKGYNSAAVDLGNRVRDIALAGNLVFADGSGIGQVNKSYSDSGSQIQSVNTDLDLSGALTGDDGASLVLTGVKALCIVAGSANPGNLTVGPAPSNGWTGPFSGTTPAIVLPAGGRLCIARGDASGWPVTAGTGDLLRIASAATAGTYTYDIVLLGI